MSRTISLDLAKDCLICTFDEQPLRIGAESPKDNLERFKIFGDPISIIGGIYKTFEGLNISIGHLRDPLKEPELLIKTIRELQKVKRGGVKIKTRSSNLMILAANLIASDYGIEIAIERPENFARKNTNETSPMKRIDAVKCLANLGIKAALQVSPCPTSARLHEEVEQLYNDVTGSKIEYKVVSGSQILPSFLLKGSYLSVLDNAVELFQNLHKEFRQAA